MRKIINCILFVAAGKILYVKIINIVCCQMINQNIIVQHYKVETELT